MVIGFVGFIANLLNRPLDGRRQRPKKCVRCEYVKLPFSLRVPKKHLELADLFSLNNFVS
jgi:hypothetical protein